MSSKRNLLFHHSQSKMYTVVQFQVRSMSLPFPLSTLDGHKPLTSTQFLSVEERYQVYLVKSAERPHLLSYEVEDENDVHESDSQGKQSPVIDGCDIPAWRIQKLGCNESGIRRSSDLHALLRVGSMNAAEMLRRSSQWPVVSRPRLSVDHIHHSRWEILREKLCRNRPPLDRQATGLDYLECIDSFGKEFEEKNIPVTIRNAATEWSALTGENKWSFENLLSRFGNIMWRFSDQHGEMMDLNCYAKYIVSDGILDDSPLAIYDSEFGDDDATCDLLKEYEVPRCFSGDLFSMVPEYFPRPPYRWILIGPERSGTGLHIDPLYTNAWVTVLQGKKRWLLFPPATPCDEVGMLDGEPQIPSSIWFDQFYDKVTSPDWPQSWRPVEVLQIPGETVFVPNGWMHLVLNLELTVAVTHNYASEFGPFERMWQQVVCDEPDFAIRWYQSMVKARPDLASRVSAWHNDYRNKEWSETLNLDCIA